MVGLVDFLLTIIIFFPIKDNENYTLEFIFIIFTQGGKSFVITVSWFFETSNHSQIHGRLLRSALPHGGSTAVFKQSNLFSAHSCSFSSSLYLSNLIRSLSSPCSFMLHLFHLLSNTDQFFMAHFPGPC